MGWYNLRMAIVTPATNRTDTFAAAHGLEVQDLIRYNLDYFLENRTMWLPVGDDFRTGAPPGRRGRDLIVNDNLLLVNDDIFAVE